MGDQSDTSLQDNQSLTTEMQKQNIQIRIFLALMVFSFEEVAGLKCEVGYSNETQIMECEGSWEKVQMMMKEEMGNKWQMLQQNMDLSGLVDDLKSKVDGLKDILNDVLKTTGDGRRKREAGEESSAEPEPEPGPSEEYFCVKKSLGGTTVKSCLAKSVAAPLTVACNVFPGSGTLCACNDQDVSNSSHLISPSARVLSLA